MMDLRSTQRHGYNLMPWSMNGRLKSNEDNHQNIADTYTLRCPLVMDLKAKALFFADCFELIFITLNGVQIVNKKVFSLQ